jgi:hypothetical protein
VIAKRHEYRESRHRLGMDGPSAGIGHVTTARCGRSDGIVGWFKRSRRAERASYKPTWRERQAAARTSKAEATLQQTERKIHEIADQIRSDLKGHP